MVNDIVEEEIDLREYLKVIWAKKTLVISIIIIFLSASYFYSFLVLQDKYQTNAILYIRNLPQDLNNSDRYSNPNVLASVITSTDMLEKTVDRAGLAELPPFKNSIAPKESAINWLKDGIKVDKNKLGNKQIVVTLEGTVDPELLQKTLKTHIEVVRQENKKFLNLDAQKDMEKLDILSSSIAEQRASTLDSIEKILDKNPSSKIAELETLIILNSRLSALDNKLSDMQMSRKSLELITSPDFNWIEIISPPFKPDVPTGPMRALNMAIAGVLGLLIGVFAAFFKKYMEDSA